MAFTLYHADEMPLVKVQSVEVKKISDDLQQVTAIIENSKIIPTHAAIDVKRKVTPADVNKLDEFLNPIKKIGDTIGILMKQEKWS